MIPKGQNAFTWRPPEQFTADDRKRQGHNGVAGGKKRAMQQRGMAVLGLKSDPARAPVRYRRVTSPDAPAS